MSQESRGNLAKVGTLVDGGLTGRRKEDKKGGKGRGPNSGPRKVCLQCPPDFSTTGARHLLFPAASSSGGRPAQRRLRPRGSPLPVPLGSFSGSSSSDPRSQSPGPASCFREPSSAASQAASFSSAEWLRDGPSAGKSRPGPASGALGSARRAGAKGRARPRLGWAGAGACGCRLPAPPGSSGGVGTERRPTEAGGEREGRGGAGRGRHVRGRDQGRRSLPAQRSWEGAGNYH